MILLCLGGLSGCAAFHPGEPRESASSSSHGGILAPLTAAGPKAPAVIQRELMDFSDLFVDGLWAEMDRQFTDEPDPSRRVAALSWKIRYGSASMEIAAGPDPRTNLLDMAILITASEWALDRYWIPEIFGEKGEGLRSFYREMKTRAWGLVSETLTDEQTKLLRSLIAQWLATNPRQFEVSSIRFRNLEGVEPEDFRKERTARGLLASVRRWLGEVNTSLLLGERMLFYVERSPRILKQQTDLTLAQIANDFPISTFNPDFSSVTSSIETLSEKLQTELNALAENPEFYPALSKTLAETRQLISNSSDLVASTTQLSASLNTTMDRLGTLLSTQQAEGRPPMDIQDSLTKAAAALASLDASISGLNALLATDASGSSRVSLLAAHLDEQATRTLDRAYNRALQLILITLAGLATLLILARILFRREKPPKVGTTPGVS